MVTWAAGAAGRVAVASATVVVHALGSAVATPVASRALPVAVVAAVAVDSGAATGHRLVRALQVAAPAAARAAPPALAAVTVAAVEGLADRLRAVMLASASGSAVCGGTRSVSVGARVSKLAGYVHRRRGASPSADVLSCPWM